MQTTSECCSIASHEALKRDARAWATMRLCGIQHVSVGSDLELRQCPFCDSTLAQPLVREAA